MPEAYMLLILYHDARCPVVCAGETGGTLIANEETKHLLVALGDRLLEENVIAGYQIVKADAPPRTRYNSEAVTL